VEEEKKNIKAQFAAIMARKNEVDKVQKELQTMLNEVKEKIVNFQQKRNDAQVRGPFLSFPRGGGRRAEHDL